MLRSQIESVDITKWLAKYCAPPRQEKCYSSLHHVVAAWITAAALAVLEVPDFAMAHAC